MDNIPKSVGNYIIQDRISELTRFPIYSACNEIGRRFVIKESKNNVDLNREFQLLMSLDHPNIIKPIEFLHVNDLSYIIFPNAQGGDLLERLTGQGDPFDKESIKKIMHDLFLAVEYIHSKEIIHRNISIENVLIFYNRGQENYTLGGFSLAVNSTKMINEHFGAIQYMAPELIEKKEYDNKIDCWALGVLMYILFTLNFPYQDGYDHTEINYNDIPPDGQDLIRHLLTSDPKQRFSAKEALQHSFFNK